MIREKGFVLTYEDNHYLIASIDADSDCFVNMTKWFEKHRF